MPRSKTRPPEPRFHIDRRAAQLLAAERLLGIGTPDVSDNDLLTTAETARWLGVSVAWLEIGRSKGYGPPFTRVAPRCIMYRRGDVRAWLQERVHTSTAEYRNSEAPR